MRNSVRNKSGLFQNSCNFQSYYNQWTDVLWLKTTSETSWWGLLRSWKRNKQPFNHWWNDKADQWAESIWRPPNDCTNAQIRSSDHIFSRKSQSIPVWGNFSLMAMQTFYRVSGFPMVPLLQCIRLTLKHYCTDGKSFSIQSWCLPNLLQLSWSN